MSIKLTISLLAIQLTFPFQIFSQPKKDSVQFTYPLKELNGFSGSFGEIRTDHFHSGVDLKTNGVPGFKVFAAEKGFVSRIKVSTLGFGKALYIDHPNGYTSVYAHLESYSPKIDSIVRAFQYQQQSFEVELFPQPNEIQVKKGELIAISGNSGTSGGPHLHFEIRNSGSQKPLNPFLNLMKIADASPPWIKSIHLYQLDSVSQINNYLTPNDVYYKPSQLKNDTIKTSGVIGIGVDVADSLNRFSSIFDAYSVELKVDGTTIYSLRFDEFAFAETRYVNSTIDYKMKVDSNKEVIKLYADPNNNFSGIKQLVNNGFINKTGKTYKIEIIIRDASFNTSTLKFNILGIKSQTNGSVKKVNGSSYAVLPWNKDNYIENELFRLFIPKATLYNHAPFSYIINKSDLSKLSPLIRIGYKTVPLHNRVELAIKTNNLPTRLREKALIASVNGKITPAGGKWENGFIKTLIFSFGDYFITLDTIPPTIKPLNFVPGNDLRKINEIRFTVKDDLSGVKTINGFIDKQWALFEYDPKIDEVKYIFDNTRIKMNSNHSLELFVKDERGNEKKYSCDFFR